MFGYAPSNGISHGTKQSISMILAPKRWLEFAKRSVIVANWANTSPHFLLLAFRSLSARVAFHSGRNQRAFYLLNTGIAWIVVKARFLFPQTISAFVILFLMGSICYVWASALQRGASASFQADVCFWHWVVGSLSEWKHDSACHVLNVSAGTH